jgi:hypothetical protein
MYSVYHYDSQFFTMITHLNGRVLNLLTENLNGPIKLYLTFDWNACRKQRVSRLCIISCARIFAIWILELFWVCGTTYFFFFLFHFKLNAFAFVFFNLNVFNIFFSMLNRCLWCHFGHFHHQNIEKLCYPCRCSRLIRTEWRHSLGLPRGDNHVKLRQ